MSCHFDHVGLLPGYLKSVKYDVLSLKRQGAGVGVIAAKLGVSKYWVYKQILDLKKKGYFPHQSHSETIVRGIRYSKSCGKDFTRPRKFCYEQVKKLRSQGKTLRELAGMFKVCKGSIEYALDTDVFK